MNTARKLLLTTAFALLLAAPVASAGYAYANCTLNCSVNITDYLGVRCFGAYGSVTSCTITHSCDLQAWGIAVTGTISYCTGAPPASCSGLTSTAGCGVSTGPADVPVPANTCNAFGEDGSVSSPLGFALATTTTTVCVDRFGPHFYY